MPLIGVKYVLYSNFQKWCTEQHSHTLFGISRETNLSALLNPTFTQTGFQSVGYKTFVANYKLIKTCLFLALDYWSL